MAEKMQKSKLILGAGTALVAVSIGLVMQAFDGGDKLGANTETPAANPADPLKLEEVTLTSGVIAGGLSQQRPEAINIDEIDAPVVAAASTSADTDLLGAQTAASTTASSTASIVPASVTPASIASIAPATSQTDKDTLSTDMAATSTAADTMELGTTQEAETSLEMACDITMDASPEPGAIVSLSLDAPCMTDERFVLHHNGMMFSAMTDQDGKADLSVPALTENAIFIASFGNGDGAVAQQTVEDLSKYGRVVVQWKGDTGLGLHAREFEAEYYSSGHIHAEAKGALEDLQRGTGGYLQRFGTRSGFDPLIAEVYSFPVGQNRKDGTVYMSVEAEVTALNCGLDVEAQTLEIREGADIRIQDLTLFMPKCDAVGDFLVLKNLVEDMTLASR